MIKLGPEGSGKLYDEIMKWKQKPMNGVILEEAFWVFGEWDFAVLFQATLYALLKGQPQHLRFRLHLSG